MLPYTMQNQSSCLNIYHILLGVWGMGKQNTAFSAKVSHVYVIPIPAVKFFYQGPYNSFMLVFNGFTI